MKLVQKFTVAYLRGKFKLLSSISPKKAAEQAFDLFCTPRSRNTKPLPAVFREAEPLSFRFQQHEVAGYRWNKDAGKRILIIHGFESSVINFDKYIKPLVKMGYEVLAFDAPAHGRSGGRRITALVYRDFIKDLMHRYGPMNAYMAHSFGGLALTLALAELKHDDRCRLVLIAPATETKTAIDQFFQFLHLQDSEVRKEFERIISRAAGHPSSWFSIGRSLKHIQARILWLHDADDKITPLADAKKIKDENHSNIKFIVTQGLGHSRIYRDAEVRKIILTFFNTGENAS